MNLIDNLNSLTLGTNKNLHLQRIIKFLNHHKKKFLQINNNNNNNNSILNDCEIFDQLVEMRDKFITIDNTNYQGDDDVNEIINIDLINFNGSKSSIHNNNNSNSNNNNDDQF